MTVGIGSIIAAPGQGGRLHFVTGVTELAKLRDGRLAVVRSRAVDAPTGARLSAPDPGAAHAPIAGAGPIRLVDPRLVSQLQDAEPLDPVAATAAARGVPVAAEPRIDATDQVSANPFDLSPAEERQVARLRQIDSAVRQEENTHAANAGQFASAPQYTYVTGPDGRRYAVGGQVNVRATNPSGDPRQAERAANILRNAAVSPNAPSAQDLIAARSFGQAAGRAAQAYAAPAQASPEPGAFDLLT
ncbi:MAG: putative metalloprotease CJM1_0395 family protein [Alphaproteobacteria bacterium]|nr:putative metalloprotease CJM1_0395 family protein [Alphaproteobacteria bacterium]